MTATASAPNLASRAISGILSIKPLYQLAKSRARTMMIKRAGTIGLPWLEEVEALKARDWSEDFAAVQNPDIAYPDYYIAPFHAYDEGNLSWNPALEVEVAAYTVHARIWQDSEMEGDPRLRESYHTALKDQLPEVPKTIADLGCSIGMSTFALQATFPQAQLTGVDLSPYFLAVAKYRADQRAQGKGKRLQGTDSSATRPTWVHAAAEATGLPTASYDLVSACLLFHELPQTAAIDILKEARRLVRPGGHLAIMDMNPRSEVYAKMPPYILTLLKSTEPYLDQYFVLDMEQAIVEAGFEPPTIVCNSPRHRTIVARAR